MQHTYTLHNHKIASCKQQPGKTGFELVDALISFLGLLCFMALLAALYIIS